MGILIAGAEDADDGSDKAELFIPSTGFQCALTDLPEPRGRHAQVGDVLCGGFTVDSGDTPDCIRKFSVSAPTL